MTVENFHSEHEWDEANRPLADIADQLALVKDFTDPVAVAIMANGPLDISYLYSYVDHDETFEDEASKKFVKWYTQTHNAPHTAMLFAAVAVEQFPTRRKERPGGIVASEFCDEFNASGYGFYSCEKRNIISADTHCTRIGRMYNVWYEENYPADGGSLFQTEKIIERWYGERQFGVLRSTYGRVKLPKEIMEMPAYALVHLLPLLRRLAITEYPANWEAAHGLVGN